MEAKELQNGAKMEPKVSLIRLQGGQMEAKELQNGGKMEPKGSQMEKKWSSKRAQIDKKINEK